MAPGREKSPRAKGVWAVWLSYPAGGNIVGLALVKWVINGGGKLLHQSFYESLLEKVHAAIGSDEPGLADEGQPPGRAVPIPNRRSRRVPS